ncbi:MULTISPECIES: LysR family transcriptional regulator [unclassified Pseudomonas]|jgi:DNA-binding transcriptional LysR family regulator|uniref:LysR family transcriptional regulator n=1 Tax=unclassified Pseudomonas TaxID=196821 RepID=UPI0007319F81|nr:MULTISPECIES: LysR family transcriptional regulator [unclassified Pseudomonas]KSW25131.1 LuxR family transcriptional regulator [Pseudomonas sp. ADP]OBP09408.1 LuxR family transcriptional regulator [Pseudomonas sp. EGD-AKN5]QOF87707.1 LysR family transcriptional regulator [Pseudomonas sp. ADPe]
MAKTRSPSLGQVSDFEIRLLRIFKTIVECGSFSAAESTLGISRSAISLHMGDLEKRLGMRLCQRGRAGFALTDEGREVYRATQSLLAALEGFRAEVNELHQHLRGELNIGIINNLVTLPQMRITHALRALKASGPGVRINIGMTTPNEIELGVLDGRLHIGVVPLISPLSGLEYSPLYDERSLLFCSREHPLFEREDAGITVAEIHSCDAVAPSYRIPAEAQERHQELNASANASDREGMAFLILTGSYIGYLPDHYAADWVAQGRMRALRPERFHYDIPLTVVMRKGRRPNLVLERFLEAVAESR